MGSDSIVTLTQGGVTYYAVLLQKQSCMTSYAILKAHHKINIITVKKLTGTSKFDEFILNFMNSNNPFKG